MQPVDIPRVALYARLPAQLKRAIRREAKRRGLTINELTVAALQRELEAPGSDLHTDDDEAAA